MTRLFPSLMTIGLLAASLLLSVGCTTSREAVTMIEPSYSYLSDTSAQADAANPLVTTTEAAQLPGTSEQLNTPPAVQEIANTTEVSPDTSMYPQPAFGRWMMTESPEQDFLFEMARLENVTR